MTKFGVSPKKSVELHRVASFTTLLKCKRSDGPLRKLSFRKKRQLEGKTFYLDISGYKHTAELERAIKQHGGKIEQFLSKHISCVITNKQGKVKSKPKQHKLEAPFTRSQGLVSVALAKENKTQQNDIVAKANSWGIQISLLSDVVEWLKSSVLFGYGGKAKSADKANEEVSQNATRKLKSPFIKVEDTSRNYKPLQKELERLQTLNFDSHKSQSPFEKPSHKINRNFCSVKSRQSSEGHKINLRSRMVARRGFCEVCERVATDVPSHLASASHHEQAKRTSFRGLDRVIAKGKPFDEFLRETKEKHLKRVARKNKSLAKRQMRHTKTTPKSSKRRMRSPKRCTTSHGSSKAAPSSTVSPIKIVFSPTKGHRIGRLSRNISMHSDSSSSLNESSAPEALPCRKRVKLTASLSVVQVDDLVLKIRRSTRHVGTSSDDQQGSAYFNYPLFQQSSATDVTDAVNRLSPIRSSFSSSHMRRSLRFITPETSGSEILECPVFMTTN